MARWLRQSTAIDVALGPFLDATDGVTAETGLTISQADVRLKKNNAAWAQVSDSTSATHEENGWYEKELDATDTNTLGSLIIAVAESGALPVWHEFNIVPANVWDSLFAADLLQVDITQIAGSATAADNLERGSLALVLSTCTTGSSTTSVVTNLTEATNDHLNGRVITFTSGALAGQSTSISDYNGSSKTLTVVALTEAPADTDEFVIS